MFKNIRVCVCDICKKPTNKIIRVIFTELNENEMPKANSEYDARPVDVCDKCMKKLQKYAHDNLAQAAPADEMEYLKQ